MLYRIGVFMILLSAAFCGGSVLVPAAIAGAGMIMMLIGRRNGDALH